MSKKKFEEKGKLNGFFRIIPAKTKPIAFDPLSNPLSSNENDFFDGESEQTDNESVGNIKSSKDDEWHRIESKTLEKSQGYTCQIKIPQSLEFINNSSTESNSKTSSPPLGNPTARLQWLENHFDEKGAVRSGSGMDREELFHFFDLCNDQLSRFWNDDQRVQVVKMVSNAETDNLISNL